jgi:hypothetical protein
MRLYTTLCVIAVFAILCSGCWYYNYPKSQYREINMSKISLGMTEEEVREVLGDPADVIGSRYYDEGHVIRVLQYLEAEFSYTSDHDRLKKDYYLYFLDGKLVQWGRPGDWEKEADQIYELRIR